MSITSKSVLEDATVAAVQGDILYFDGTNWVKLPAGADGYVLTTHGPSADPTWTEATGGPGGSSVGFIAPVRAVADTNITLSGLQTINDVSLAVDDRVAVIGQTSAWFNGVYAASSGSWTRVSDLSLASHFIDGMIIPVGKEDTKYGGEIIRYNTVGTITLGVTNLSFKRLNEQNRRLPLAGTNWYWKLDGSSNGLTNIGSVDSSVLVATGSIYDTVNDSGFTPDGSDSVLGTGSRFQAGYPSTAYLSVSSPGVPTNAQSFGVSMWIILNTIPTAGTAYIFGRWDTTVPGFGMYIGLTTTSKIQFFLRANTTTTTNSTYTILQGVPYYIECSYDGSTQRIAVNGVEVTDYGGSFSNSGNVAWSTGNWFVFNKDVSTDGNNGFCGSVEEIRINSPRTNTGRAQTNRGLGRSGRF